MAEYSSNTDLSQGQIDTDLSDLFVGFPPAQAGIEPEPSDLFERAPQRIPNVDVALSLAARGLAVCPVRQWGDGDGWKPIARFPELATTDPTQIRKWWREWPEARVALITGARNGISVLDVDLKNGKDGLLSLSTLGFDDHRAMTPIRSLRTRLDLREQRTDGRTSPRQVGMEHDRRSLGPLHAGHKIPRVEGLGIGLLPCAEHPRGLGLASDAIH